MSLKEKLIRGAGEQLVQMAVGPRCWGLIVYEPSLSPEMISEIANEQ